MTSVVDHPRAREARVPPHSIEAEESVLGSMMFSAEAIATVIERVKHQDFYRPAHRHIFEAIISIYGRGEPVDAITTLEELRRRGALGEGLTALQVLDLVERVPSPASAEYYARIVADHALLRRLIDAASRIMSTAYEVPEDPRKAADEAEQLIYSVARAEDGDEVV